MRYFLLALTISILMTCNTYAAPCYGTTMPKQKEIDAGLQYYSIFKRYQEREAGKLRSGQEFVLFSYGVFDWLSIDAKGGAGFIKQHPLGRDEIDYPTFLGGGYGFRLRLYEKEKVKAVFGFQHISVHPYSIYAGGVKHKAVLDDWQVSALASYALGKFTPYLGTRWSRAGYIHWVDGQRDLVKSDLTKSWGLIAGLDIPLSSKMWVNIEGSWFDSDAAALSLNYRF